MHELRKIILSRVAFRCAFFISYKRRIPPVTMDFMFFFNSCLLGAGLAMDAFSVSLANGLNEPCMKKGRMCAIAGVFSFFQFLMPIIGWFCVHLFLQYFRIFEKFIPWIALFLLAFIGGKMLLEGFRKKECGPCECRAVGIGALLLQGVATSIDALSVGFTISSYNKAMAFVACLIIAVVTFFLCLGGLFIGKKFGTKLESKASILGGTILIIIGLEIFLTGIGVF